MSYSIRWLFAFVAIAALFAAAFTFQTEWWTLGIVTLTLVMLTAATVGTSIRLLDRPFWVPFCVAGWIYMWAANTTGLSLNLPTTRLAFELWKTSNPEAVSDMITRVPSDTMYRFVASRVYMAEPFHIIDLVHCFSALIFATLAGLIASLCVQRASKSAER